MMGTKEESIFHDRIRGFEISEILPKRWMSRDISCECDTGLDIILLEKLYEFKTFRTLEWDGKPVWGPRVIREGVVRTVLEILQVSFYVLTPLFEKSIQFIKLYETEGGVHFTRLEMIPCDTIEELPVIGDTIDGMIETLTGLFDVVTDAPQSLNIRALLRCLGSLNMTIPPTPPAVMT